MEEQKYCYFQFKYLCNLKEGEEVRVVGSIEELGNWDIKKSEKLMFSKLDIPIWKSKENIKIPQNSTFEYKYVIYKNGNFDRWENIPSHINRKFTILNMIRVIILDKENNINSQIEKCDYINNNNDFIHLNKNDKNLYEEISNPNYDKYDKDESINIYTYKNEGNFSNNEEFDKIDDKFLDLNYESSNENEETFQKRQNSIKLLDINDNDEIIICSFYLPFNAVKNDKNEYDLELTNEPLYHTLYRLIKNKKNIKWFGLLKHQYFFLEEEKKQLSNKLKEKNMFILNIPQDIFNTILILFNEIFEPLFHYISLTPEIIENFSHFSIYWEAYKKYSENICDTIISYLNQKTLIYLNDYPFFLVPSFLYSKCHQEKQSVFQNLSIGIFMHSPFPSNEVFKKIPFREEIIKSMINCSVIGFHTFENSRNFTKCAKRLLSINYESAINGDLAINYYGRTAMIRVKNATPEIDFLKEDFESNDFKKFYNEIKNKFPNKTIYVSLDHMKFLSSIKNKLEGYRKFLSDMGEKGKKNVYLQYIRYSTNDLDKNGNLILDNSQKEMLEKIHLLSKKIKDQFGDDILILIEKKVSYLERLAIFASADCFLRTSKQESFSLGLYEFLILKKFLNQEKTICYILSELSGVNTSLAGTIKINPFDYNSIYNGFIQSNQIMFGEHDERNILTLEKDFQHVMKSSCKDWFYSFLKDIKNTKLSDENTYYLGVGEGLNFKLMKIKSTLKKLDFENCVNSYKKSNKRILFLDYEGTLPSNYNSNDDNLIQSKGKKPSEEILNLLNKLTKDEKNTIFIITGRGINLVNEWFDKIDNLGLAAEHGFMYKINKIEKNENEKNEKNEKKENWKSMIKNYNNEWIHSCIEILEPYTERCEGSFLEIKKSSIVWQYSDCDQELGKSFASVITSELECSLKRLDLKIINGKGYVEVIATGINKGYFISYILKQFFNQGIFFDFIMCLGDDTTDEKMFHFLNDKKNAIKKYCEGVNIFSCTVGKKPSKANFYVNSPFDVQELISEFVKTNSENNE